MSIRAKKTLWSVVVLGFLVGAVLTPVLFAQLSGEPGPTLVAPVQPELTPQAFQSKVLTWLEAISVVVTAFGALALIVVNKYFEIKAKITEQNERQNRLHDTQERQNGQMVGLAAQLPPTPAVVVVPPPVVAPAPSRPSDPSPTSATSTI